jgi:DNA-directed RNA polymerase subunit RPC12/RpoP
MATFLARGGAIKRGPDVVPTLYTCETCGAQSVVGIAENQRRGVRCPKCGALRNTG